MRSASSSRTPSCCSRWRRASVPIAPRPRACRAVAAARRGRQPGAARRARRAGGAPPPLPLGGRGARRLRRARRRAGRRQGLQRRGVAQVGARPGARRRCATPMPSRAAYRDMQAAAQAAGVALSGVLVAELVRGQRELMIGARLDPVFGPVVLVGDGGKYVEAMPDAQVLLPPFDAARVAGDAAPPAHRAAARRRARRAAARRRRRSAAPSSPSAT